MPSYLYRCPVGHEHLIVCSPDDPTKRLYDTKQMICTHPSYDNGITTYDDGTPVEPHDCGGVFRRVWKGVQIGRVMHEHFNNSAGQVISSNRQFDDAMKRASEDHERRTGFPANFQAVDLNDPAVAPKDDSGMRETHDAAVARGDKEPTRKAVWL